MTSQEIHALLTGILRKLFKDETLVARADLAARDVRGWDSLAHIHLILEVERCFNIKFAFMEIAEFKNIGELVQIVEKKLEMYGRLTGIMREVFEDETLIALPEVKAPDVKGWDSLAHIHFVLEVERGFKVKFTTREIAELENVGGLAKIVEKKLS
jgi:acyl carrier protein